MQHYDVIVIGAGAAGVAAIKRAVSHGMKTALIASSKSDIGGTCLTQGCIPTKFFIQCAKKNMAWPEVCEKSAAMIAGIQQGFCAYAQAKGVALLYGKASFAGDKRVRVGSEEISATHIVIAAGSVPKMFLTGSNIIAAQDIFIRPHIGENILIVGAGYIGVEFASMLAMYGKRVTVIEKESRVLPLSSQRLSARLAGILTKKGIRFETGIDAQNYARQAFDTIVVSIGRASPSAELCLDAAGVSVNEHGWIPVSGPMRTNRDGVYACGDITGTKMLAYTAEYQARLCIDAIAGIHSEENYDVLPQCVFSSPALAYVGITYEQAQEQGISCRLIRTNFLKYASSYVYDDTDGYLEIVAGDQGRILGAAVISGSAGELISIISVCMKNNISLEGLKQCLLIHPTLSEIIPLALNE